VEVASDCEVTLEANPEDMTLSLACQLLSAGINRISIGVQSFNDQELVLLGRTHNASRATEAIEAVHRAGIDNITIDLMYELPGQTLNRWESTLRALSDLPITHLSLYNLTFEPQTVFFKHQSQLLPQLPPAEERLQMLQQAVQALEAIGLKRYEISAFAQPGRHSRHNTGYWIGRPFFGFGPSAFSYWEKRRFSNSSNFNKYLNLMNQGCFPVDFEEQLPHPRDLQELFAIRLRLLEGVDLKQFAELYGALPASIEKALCTLIEKGWIEQERDFVRLTASGQLFYDSVAMEII
jgi:oxygen-independent coproporphyrinogen-3 oxidase